VLDDLANVIQALVEHEVVKLFRRTPIFFESIIHGSVRAALPEASNTEISGEPPSGRASSAASHCSAARAATPTFLLDHRTSGSCQGRPQIVWLDGTKLREEFTQETRITS
jgi:hypothetical protein